MRRLSALLVLTLVLGLAPQVRGDQEAASPAPPAQPAEAEADSLPIVTLREAAAQGQVDAHGYSPQSYRRVHVKVRNKTKEALHVDMCASYLRPRRSGSCQRLGIGPPIVPRPKKKKGRFPPGTVIVRLEPGETQDVEFQTCCLDAGLSAPGNQTFVVAKAALPPVREGVLRWWADNPEVPQSHVNAAIWANRDTVHRTRIELAPYVSTFSRTVATHGGTVYRLQGGELRSIDAEGIERLLGTEIYQVAPVDGAVYTVQIGPDGQPDLMRLGITGAEAWSFVLDLPARFELRDVIPGPDGNLVLVGMTDHFSERRSGFHFWSRAARQLSAPLESGGREGLSVRPMRRNRLLLATKRVAEGPSYRAGERYGEKSAIFDFHILDLKTGALELEKSFWNVRAVQAGPAGIFGVSHKGRLRRLVRMSWKDLGPSETIEQILLVGDKGVWLQPEVGRIRLVSARSGNTILEPNVRRRDMEVFDLDPVTDDLVYLRGGEIWRLRHGETEPEKVEPSHGR